MNGIDNFLSLWYSPLTAFCRDSEAGATGASESVAPPLGGPYA